MKRVAKSAFALFAMTIAATALAQPTFPPAPPPPPPPPSRRVPVLRPLPTASVPRNLRAHVGGDSASRLLRSSDADQRLRGIQRAASLGTTETVTILSDALAMPNVRSDTRALLEIARGLAHAPDSDRTRAGLLAIVNTGKFPPARGDSIEDGDPVARAELAREVAAIALARSDRSAESLYGIARSGGSGRPAALVGLSVHPPRDPGFFGTAGTSLAPEVVGLLGELGDLRALDVLHGAARSSDVSVRSAALVALAQLGDERAIPLARAAIAESDVHLRAASGEVFILLNTPERFKATSALVADEATTMIGLRMAERVFNGEITKAVAARAQGPIDRETRLAAIRALGRSPDPEAAKALGGVASDFPYETLSALARSPAPNAGATILALAGKQPSLAARATIVRALVRGERTREGDKLIEHLANRPLSVFGRVALGDDDVETFIEDKDPKVRRAAVAGASARPPTASRERLFLKRIAKEDDAVARELLAIGLVGGDRDGLVKTSTLSERAESGSGDAALAGFAFARRADEKAASKIDQLLDSRDPVMRAHVARGLGVAPLADATGRLADLYAYETEADVRRAVVTALASRVADADAPQRKRTLAIAAELDPDGEARLAARRALASVADPLGSAAVHEVAWLRVTSPGGTPPGDSYVGSFVRADGIAVPIAFDEEGYALVPGLPPGEGRLVLAPRLPREKK